MTTAVLVIDVQSALFDPQPKPFDVDAVLEKINKVTNWARKLNYPVIYIQHEQVKGIMEYESKGWQLHAELLTKPNDIIVRKTTPDSFLHTNLENVLINKRVKHLIITGYASEFCVDTTVRRAASLGYSIELVSDAHTTHDKKHASGEAIRLHHNCTLPEVTSFGVRITTPETNDLIKCFKH